MSIDETLDEILWMVQYDSKQRIDAISEIKAAVLAELPEERKFANPYAQMGYCIALTDIKNKLQ